MIFRDGRCWRVVVAQPGHEPLNPTMISQGLGRRRALAIAVALLLTLMLAIIAAGYEGKRIAQVALLALPPVLWLRLPLVSAR